MVEEAKRHWSEHVDEATGRTFYYDSTSKESVWIEPPELTGTQFTCFTSSKLQVLTPEELSTARRDLAMLTDEGGSSSLHLAAKKGHRDVGQALVAQFTTHFTS